MNAEPPGNWRVDGPSGTMTIDRLEVNTTEGKIRNAVSEYHGALDRREDGVIAGHRLVDAVQDILNMPWRQKQPAAADSKGAA